MTRMTRMGRMKRGGQAFDFSQLPHCLILSEPRL